MNKDEVLKELGKIESDIGCKFPVLYKKFLSEEVGGADAYEFTKKMEKLSVYLIIKT